MDIPYPAVKTTLKYDTELVLERAHYKYALYGTHIVQNADFIQQEFLILCHSTDTHLHQEIGITADVIALVHFRPQLDLVAEPIGVSLVYLLEADQTKNGKTPVDLLGVYYCRVSLYYSGAFQPAVPLECRSGGQMDSSRQLLVGEPAVELELTKYPDISLVKCHILSIG